ncbi:MAG TPA: indole-3-glycerol phosphate synthase TrpC [Solirubrobacteraceae bacterium]|jgi:indole-3-glycerol phosphate synthase|nr:indole-3-glycerol phosphate synthase TrpC [Solirubrobacteraceae bacterium]
MSQETTTVLERIVAETRRELERRKRELPLRELRAAALGHVRPTSAGRRFHDALNGSGVGVIAEFKRRSPSAGTLREQPDLAEIVSAYERGGAVAVSILTEGPNFEGTLDDLRAARAACDLPLLRKDFVVDVYQLYEALAADADAVLLIVAALKPAELAALHACALELGLDALVEVHDREELRGALEIGADIVGINNRDLRDFSVDLQRTEALMEHIPSGVTVVSESGIAGVEQVRRLRARGVRAVLVGESLMRADDPAAALRALTSERPDMI